MLASFGNNRNPVFILRALAVNYQTVFKFICA